MKDEEFLVALGGIILFVAAIVFCVFGIVQANATDAACLAAGYPTGTVVYFPTFRKYCIKRVNQTDVVVPLESVDK